MKLGTVQCRRFANLWAKIRARARVKFRMGI
jgi:hypothetical protein